MSTVSSLLDAAKYDLRDYGAKEFDPTQMVHYLNRCIKILDRALIALQSDQTLTESDLVVASGANSATVPTASVNIREIWDSDDTIMVKVSARNLYELRMYKSGDTSQPRNWSHIKEKIEFDVTTDQEYTFTCYHDGMSTTVVVAGDMPYSGRYDEYLREALIMMAQAKKHKKLPQTDAVYLQMFTANLQQDIINRNFVPKKRLGF